MALATEGQNAFITGEKNINENIATIIIEEMIAIKRKLSLYLPFIFQENFRNY